MTDQDTLYVFMPYLTINEREQIRGIEFRGTYDLDDLSDEESRHIRRLANVFYLRDDFQAQGCVCALLHVPRTLEERSAVLQRLYDAQTIITYLCTTPDPRWGGTFLVNEHGTMFTFQRRRFTSALLRPLSARKTPTEARPTNRLDDVDGYFGYRDGINEVWVGENSRIYPSVPFLTRIAQDSISYMLRSLRDPSNWALEQIARDPNVSLSDADRQVLMAMEWHNASTSELVTEEEKLLRLAIAFECLLGLERGEEVTARLRESILMLLGRVPLLDSWVQQFYAARGQIVHQGISTQLRFHPLPSDQLSKVRKGKELPPTYGGLVHHGRLIFRLCANALRSSRRLSHRTEVGHLLLDDLQRLREICRILNGTPGTPEHLLGLVAPYVRTLHGFTREAVQPVDRQALIGAAKRIFEIFLRIDDQPGAELENAMRLLIGTTDSDPDETVEDRLRHLERLITGGQPPFSEPFSPEAATPKQIVNTFVRYATMWCYLS